MKFIFQEIFFFSILDNTEVVTVRFTKKYTAAIVFSALMAKVWRVFEL